jgi:FSR family fosmidomycin resistance protein-like MFS transporter
LISFILFNPASGAFVTLSQANLMDSDTARHEQNMARWAFAGSLGVLTGPILLGAFVHFGLGWRGTFALLASFSALCLLLAMRRIPPDATSHVPFPSSRSVFDGFRAALSTLKRRDADAWRWLLLLEFADLMLDVLLSYLALYFVDVAQVTESQAGIAITIWLALGLLTDFLFIPFIDRQPNSMKYLRLTAALELAAFSVFLVVPGFIPKLIAIVFVNLFNTGWYPILQGRLYSSLPGQSASIMAIGSVTAPFAKILPLLIGLLADRFGLGIAIWVLLLGPLVLLIGLPRNNLPHRT